ncbi:unnamed protein product [Sphagnum balticum]
MVGAVTANGMAKRTRTTYPRSRSEPNNWPSTRTTLIMPRSSSSPLSFRPLELDTMPNASPNDDNDVDVQVCDDDDVFDTVNVDSLDRDIEREQALLSTR